MQSPAPVRAVFALALVVAGDGCACGPPVAEPPAAPPLVELVDPAIGTGGFAFAYGAAFLGAAAPHGLVKAGPDTTGDFGELRFLHTSGNWADDATVLCFSHLHLHGVGLPEGGVVALMPTTSFDPARPRATAYAATRANERAAPGDYAVHLAEPDVDVELVAATHASLDSFTFPDGTADAVVVLDVRRTIVEGTVRASAFTVDGAVPVAGVPVAGARVAGSLHTQGSLSPPGGYDVFFVVDADAPFSATALLDADGVTVTGAALSFGARDASAPVRLRVALSYVDADGAARNLDADMPSFDVDAARKRARDAWDRVLGRVRLFGGSDDDRVVFASALYRSFLMPDVESDVDGRNRWPDGAVHTADGFAMMTDLSLWDTYRTVQPLYALMAPADARDVALSIVQWTTALGHGPLWPMATGDASVMIGSPGELVLADALARGVVSADDVTPAWDALRAAALDAAEPANGRGGRDNVVAYDAHGGWAPAPARAPVSTTLEYQAADTALARIARALGHDADAARLETRARGWGGLFDPDTGFLRARGDDGAFTIAAADFAPENFSDDYTEADAWQSLFPIDDVAGIDAVYGGRAAALGKLRDLFDRTTADWDTRDKTASTFGIAPLPFHWQGNEPSLHVSALAFDLGDRGLGTAFVRWVMTTQYRRAVDGIPGNDDGGALSSWWVLAALGLHPVAGGPDWVVGAPLFPKVEVDTAGGTLTITAVTGADAARTAALDGAPLSGPRVDHAALVSGGALDVN